MYAWHELVRLCQQRLTRRGFAYGVSASALATGTLSLRDVVTLHADELKRQQKAMILLWMQGGPSQLETFDPKPGTAQGGETTAIATRTPGLQIASAWTRTAQMTDRLAIIRSMNNKEGNHERATYQLHTGYMPTGSVKHPILGSSIAERIAPRDLDLPSVVTIGNQRVGAGAGYLGVDYEPFHVSEPGTLPENVATRVGAPRLKRRLELMGRLDNQFALRAGQAPVDEHQSLYAQASGLVLSPLTKAFDLSEEPQTLRDQYGSGDFGRGCLLARRLIEAGVTYVEVRHGNWDTHFDNFSRTTELSSEVDAAMATLLADLQDRGRLDSTLVVWMGEFGRTPRINPRGGRDHFPRVFNAALAGGGVKGGRVIGRSSADGMSIEDRPVSVGDLFASVCHALGVDPKHESMSPLGRPMRIVDQGTVVDELFA